MKPQKVLEVEITLDEEMLATSPGTKEIYMERVASKAPDAATIEDEIAALGLDKVVEKGRTIFARDKLGNPGIFCYIIKGFFKNACKAMREADGAESKSLTSYKTKIDNLIFIRPVEYDPVTNPKKLLLIEPPKDPEEESGEGICERPLRASTPQGERITLASSESVPVGSTIRFKILLYKAEMEKYVIEWLDYGEFNGLGCWHNSGKGAFTWRDIKGLDGEDMTKKRRGRKKKDEVSE